MQHRDQQTRPEPAADAPAAAGGTNLPTMPMTAPLENALAYETAQKPVVESRLLSDMESLDGWEHLGYGSISLSTERSHTGRASLLLTSPTKGPEPNHPSSHGRPWGAANAVYRVDNEDWSEWNRISFWVYPDLPGFRTVSMNMVLHNDNRDDAAISSLHFDDAFMTFESPDGYYYFNLHSGSNYQLLENHTWNRVTWEIPHIRRDKVLGVSLRYRLQGNEPEATDTVRYYFDELCLEKIEQPEHFEGWEVAPGHIAHNHVGYPVGSPKVALASDLSAKTFQLIDAETKKVALDRPIATKTTHLGAFQVLDFSEIDASGTYLLKAGEAQTRAFRIDRFDDLYRGTLVKLTNFFYAERCGTEVPGVHSVCHRDFTVTHDGKRIVINGGWHDAGDLSQSTQHTSGAVHAFLSLARMLQDSDAELSERLLEEAKWGLDWVLKTRFGDGYRVNWGVMDFWTDGIFGTVDDVTATMETTPGGNRDAYVLTNLHGARAEAKAAMLLAKDDPITADYALRCAREDWSYAVAGIKDLDMNVAGIALAAAITLHEATSDDAYREAAVSYADYIIACQQQEDVSPDVPVRGFFYDSAGREKFPMLRSITSRDKYAVTGLIDLLVAFPGHENAAKWEAAIRLHADYQKAMASCTDPYFMLPSGLCDVEAAEDEIEAAKIRNGVRLSDRYYVRCFPVWTTGRGNSSVVLSRAIGLAAIARHLQDGELLHLAYRQIDWILGLNPFNQSVMWGEGYRHQALYTPLSGDIVGAIPCGIHTKFNRDAPYWPSDNWHNPKEIWVHSTSDMLWLVQYFFQDVRSDSE